MATYPYCLEPGLTNDQLKTIERSLTATDFRYRYNTIFINSLETYTNSIFTINNFCPRIERLQQILNSRTHRYNNVIGYNKIRDITGNNNTYIGTNESLSNINTSNTITLGYNIVPENNTVQFKPNKEGGVFRLVASNTASTYTIAQENNSNIFHDNYTSHIKNTEILTIDSSLSSLNTNLFTYQTDISSVNTDILIKETSLSASASNTVINTGSFNLSAVDSNVFLNSTNIVLTGNSIALGSTGRTHQSNMVVFSNFNFTDNKRVQKADFMLQGITSGSTLTEIFCDNVSTPIIIPNNSVWSGLINVIGYGVSDDDIARYLRQVTVSKINNTTTIEAESIVGIDIEQSYSPGIDNDLSITANSTGLVIRVKGCNGTWKWSAYADGLLMYI